MTGKNTLLIAALALALPNVQAHAGEGQFDAQVFRTSGAPRDLTVIQKTEIVGRFSPVFGFHTDFSLNPLVLIHNAFGDELEVVGARMNLTGTVALGLHEFFDLQLAVPFVGWQSSDNLHPIGTEGEVQSTVLADMRLSGRLSLGFINGLKRLGDKGFAMAISGTLNLPTGNVRAFASDGVLTGSVSLLADYRLPTGGIITANAGIWLRPEREFAGTRIGDMGSFGVAGETYIKRNWGLSVLGGVYGYPTLNKFPDSARAFPAEMFLALRRQTDYGITWTVGGSFGSTCGIGQLGFRLFSGLTWHPSSSREQEKIDRILRRENLDPDSDGVISEQDACPDVPGPLENRGCPDTDKDEDGWVDRVDECPTLAGGERGKKGCPPAYIRGDQIVILEKVHFATNEDEVLEESKPILRDIARLLIAHPEAQRINIEGHTDIRASGDYNLALSQRRVNSVTAFLIGEGVDPRRLEARGYGHTRPLVDDTHCNASDEELGPECKFLTSQNRRVVYRIAHRCAALAPGSKQDPSTCSIARLEGDNIITLDTIRFPAGSYIVPAGATKTLNDVATLLKQHPEIVKVRVEGHSNVHGLSRVDRRLSRKRAEAIEAYLIARGIRRSRLEAKGYGHARPKYDDNQCLDAAEASTPYCKFVTFKNQRFTFRVIRWSNGASGRRSVQQGSGLNSLTPRR